LPTGLISFDTSGKEKFQKKVHRSAFLGIYALVTFHPDEADDKHISLAAEGGAALPLVHRFDRILR
jgi:hypothetical protein